MKYLVLLVVVVVAIGIWRSRRGSRPAAAQRTQPALPQEMLACAHCGTHIPQNDALMEQGRAYCSAEHRRRGPG